MKEKLTGFGDAYEEAIDLPSYKHEYIFKYLQISPSYWIAHRMIALGEKIPNEDLPNNFDKVLETYRKLGDVYLKEFYEWWVAGASNAFASQKKKQVWIGIDPTKPKDRLIKEFEVFLSKLESKNANAEEGFVFEVNKIRLSSLEDRFNLVHERAWRNGKYWQKEPLWKLLRWGQYPTERRKEIRINSKKKSSNVEVRAYLTMLASKNLKIALDIAENAARGKFPSQEPIETGLNFDWDRIAQQSNDTELNFEMIDKFKAENKDYMKYFSPSRGHRKSSKKIKKPDFSEALQKED
jgi:hypothetical protein